MNTRGPARTGMLPPASPIGWEAEAPTGRLPRITPPGCARPTGLPTAAPYGQCPFAAPARPVVEIGRQLAGMVAGVLVLLVLLALLGGLLQLTGAVMG